LESNALLSIERRAGAPARVFLRHESGNGDAYFLPGASGTTDGEFEDINQYVRLPYVFWAEGWMAALSAPALVTLLMLLDVATLENTKSVWISESLRRERYGLSDDTWTRGTSELRRLELVVVRRQAIGNDFDWRRLRNVYEIRSDRFTSRPARIARKSVAKSSQGSESKHGT
jgi:hypothetical protein